MSQTSIQSELVHEEPLPPHGRLARFRRASNTMDLNLVAMIDVVFLLLTYFILTASFTLGEEVYEMQLPDPQSGQIEDPFALPETPIVVRLSSVGTGPGDYRIQLDLPTDPIQSYEQLFRFLSDQQIRPDNPRGLLSVDVPLIIKPDAETHWHHTVGVVNACVRAQYQNVQLVEP